jgi:hypothetical protein
MWASLIATVSWLLARLPAFEFERLAEIDD